SLLPLIHALPPLSLPQHPCLFFFQSSRPPRHLPSFPTRRSSDLANPTSVIASTPNQQARQPARAAACGSPAPKCCPTSVEPAIRSEEHTSELQSLTNLVCRLLLEKKKQKH